MAFIAHCLYCQHKMQAPPSAAGMSVRCPKCQNYFTVVPIEIKATTQDDRFAAKTPVAAPFIAVAAPAVTRAAVAATESPNPSPVTHPTESGAAPAPAMGIPVAPPPKPKRAATIIVPQTQTDFATQPILRRPGSLAGMLSLAICGIGLMCASIAGWGLFPTFTARLSRATFPLAVAGLLVGVIGWLSLLGQSRRQTARIFPLAGSLASAALLAVCLFRPGLLGPNYTLWQGNSTKLGNAQFIPISFGAGARGALHYDGWADASLAALQQGDMRVQITAAAVEPIKVKPEKAELAETKFLVLHVLLQQVSSRRDLRYYHWGARNPRNSTDKPRLVDSSGREFKYIEFGDGTLIDKQMLEKELYAGAIVPTVLVFEAPPPGTTGLRLTLPCHAWEGQGEFKFHIPRDFIKRTI